MTALFDRLNLRPGERRLVIIVALVVGVLLHIWFVRPLFAQRTETKRALDNSVKNLELANKKIAMAKAPDGYEAQLRKLEGEGANIAADEQEIQLLRTVMSQVAESKITVNSYGQVTKTATTKTNEFFEEQTMKISFAASETNLVDFLVNIGGGTSMLRVRDLELRPADQSRQRLSGTMTLVASYQKKNPSAAPAKPAATTNRPSTMRPSSTQTPKKTNSPAPPPKKN